MRAVLERLGGNREPPRLLAIYVCASAGEPMRSVDSVQVVAGGGLAGDRYCLGTGHWHPVESCDVTLISEDDLLRARRRLHVQLDHGEHRRNLVVTGISTHQLRDRRFRIGPALFGWQRPRPPCGYLNQVTGQNVARALRANSGVCLSALSGGLIRVGDPLVLDDG